MIGLMVAAVYDGFRPHPSPLMLRHPFAGQTLGLGDLVGVHAGRKNILALLSVNHALSHRYVLPVVVHVMSWPQHSGDLILPWPFGHLDTCTWLPSSSVRLSFTSGASHLPQVALTLIPHLSHSYVAIFPHSLFELICQTCC